MEEGGRSAIVKLTPISKFYLPLLILPTTTITIYTYMKTKIKKEEKKVNETKGWKDGFMPINKRRKKKRVFFFFGIVQVERMPNIVPTVEEGELNAMMINRFH